MYKLDIPSNDLFIDLADLRKRRDKDIKKMLDLLIELEDQ
ncbi:unnamed protein product, partial [marine sediment metagenome]